MAQASSLKVPLITSGITLQVSLTGLRKFRARAWLGVKILQLAAWVIGLELEVSIRSEHQDPAPRPSLAIPPYRLSVADLDRYDSPVTWQEANRILVKLNGVEVKGVLAYDCAAGWVEAIEHDRDGHAIVRDGKLAITRMSGEVAAVWREAA